jgi:Na+/serine symporter
MQSILSALKTGDAKTRLGIIADIVSILGVSVATVIGGSFALSGSPNVENILGTAIIALLGLTASSIVLILYLTSSSWIQVKFSAKSTIKNLLLLALWSTFLALILVASFVSYEYISSTRFINHA